MFVSVILKYIIFTFNKLHMFTKSFFYLEMSFGFKIVCLNIRVTNQKHQYAKDTGKLHFVQYGNTKPTRTIHIHSSGLTSFLLSINYI